MCTQSCSCVHIRLYGALPKQACETTRPATPSPQACAIPFTLPPVDIVSFETTAAHAPAPAPSPTDEALADALANAAAATLPPPPPPPGMQRQLSAEGGSLFQSALSGDAYGLIASRNDVVFDCQNCRQKIRAPAGADKVRCPHCSSINVYMGCGGCRDPLYFLDTVRSVRCQNCNAINKIR